MKLNNYIKKCYQILPVLLEYKSPWKITENANEIIKNIISTLKSDEYNINWTVAIHKTAKIENGVVLKDNIVIEKDCFVATGAYLRGWVYLAEKVTIWPWVEIKSSFIFKKSRIAHFNYIWDSIIGEDVNFEAGAITANYYNETGKNIKMIINNKIVKTWVKKFGALIGDDARIWANAVLAPGSVLIPWKIISRLEYYDHS